MRRSFLALLLLAAAVPAADYPQAGLKVDVPDGWDRESQREGGATLFAAVLPVSKEQQVRFSIEKGPGLDFDAESWLEGGRVHKEAVLDEVTEAFRAEEGVKVGGRRAAGYTIAGKATAGDGKTYDLHYRVRAVEHGGSLFEITELSYNGAQKSDPAALEAMWNAISFYQPKPPETDWAPPPGAEPAEVLDEAGNFKLQLPAGWTAVLQGDETGQSAQRLVAHRLNANGEPIAEFSVLRIEFLRASVFTEHTPSTMLELLQDNKGLRIFDNIYGQDTDPRIHTDESFDKRLGELEKSGAYEIRDRTKAQYEQIMEAEEQVAKGVKDVAVPEFAETVVRGRVALLSPHVYVTASRTLVPTEADDETYLAELQSILQSFQFLSSQRKPPGLIVGGVEIGNTKDDPKYAEDRKDEIEWEAKFGGKALDELGIDFVIPAGFVRVKEAEVMDPDGSGGRFLFLAAQDKNNNWVTVEVWATSDKVLSRRNLKFQDKKELFETWKSNWTNKARGTGRIPEKPRSFKLGNMNGKAHLFEGQVEGFDSTRTCFVEDKGGWRVQIYIETMAKGAEVFEEGIKVLERRVRIKL